MLFVCLFVGCCSASAQICNIKKAEIMRKQFLQFLQNWLLQRVSLNERHGFHVTEVTKIPKGYYAVVSIELKPIPAHPLVLEAMKMPEYA